MAPFCLRNATLHPGTDGYYSLVRTKGKRGSDYCLPDIFFSSALTFINFCATLETDQGLNIGRQTRVSSRQEGHVGSNLHQYLPATLGWFDDQVPRCVHLSTGKMGITPEHPEITPEHPEELSRRKSHTRMGLNLSLPAAKVLQHSLIFLLNTSHVTSVN